MKVVEADADTVYTWGDACLGWRLLELDGLQLRQERMPPGAREEPHEHRHARQVFFVLEGEMTMLTPQAVLRAGPRQSLHVPPGQPHWVRNDGAADLVFLLVSAPSTAGDRLPVDPAGWPGTALLSHPPTAEGDRR